jgi:hypothetical protein
MWSSLGVAGSLPITKHTLFHVLVIKMHARNPEFDLVFLLYRMIVLSLMPHTYGCDFVFFRFLQLTFPAGTSLISSWGSMCMFLLYSIDSLLPHTGRRSHQSISSRSGLHQFHRLQERYPGMTLRSISGAGPPTATSQCSRQSQKVHTHCPEHEDIILAHICCK